MFTHGLLDTCVDKNWAPFEKMILKVIYIFHKISVEKKILEIFCALLSNVVGDKKLRSYLAFKGFGKKIREKLRKQIMPPQTSKTTEYTYFCLYVIVLLEINKKGF